MCRNVGSRDLLGVDAASPFGLRMQEAASDAAGQVDGGICFCMQHHVAAGELLVGMETLVGRGGNV